MMLDAPTREELARRRRKLKLLLGPLLLTFAAQGVGVALAPALLERAPALLVILAPLTRHLVLVSPALDTPTFFAVGFMGFFLPDPFSYLLGREYGSAAVDWIVRRSGAARRWIQWVERMFRRAAPVVLLVSPGPFVNLLAGASGMRVLPWLALNVAGTLAALVLIRMFGDALAAPIAAIRVFIEANVVVLTIGSGALVALGVLLRRRRMRRLAQAAQRSDAVVGEG
jgi:membrane protein DedA with SNARE-associated domain